MKKNKYNFSSHEAPRTTALRYLVQSAPWLLGLITYLSYRPSLIYSFQFDDIANIRKFFNIRHATFSSLFFSGPRWISYWMNTVHFKLARFEPYVYRRTNLCAHTITGIMVFFLFKKLLEQLNEGSFFYRNRFMISFATAGLFLLHPVQTQTVSYVIQGQLEGLATLFTVSLCLWFTMLAKATTSLQKTVYATLMYISAFLATGTKEIAIVSPLLLVTVDWFFIARGNLESFKKRLIIHGSIFAIVWGAYLYFYKPGYFINMFGLKMEARNNIGNILTETQNEKILPLHFLISQFKVILHYLWMFIWPFGISVEYDWKLSRSFFSPDSLFPFLVLCVLAAVIVSLLRKNKTNVIAFAAIWFAIAIAPRSSIVPSSELLSDYKTYLASIGILFLLACGLVKLWETFANFKKENPTESFKIQYAVFTLFLLPVGFATYSRNKVWRSPAEFWENIIQNAPGKARAYNNYAVALCEMDKYQEAVPYYKKAIEMDGKYPDPINNLAVAYSILGKVDAAIAVLQHSIKLQPRYPEGYNNLASFYITKEEYGKAEEALKTALTLRPYYGKAHFNYGKLCVSLNRPEEAFDHFKKACTECDLDDETGFKIYGQVSMKLRKLDDAIVAYTQLIKFNPREFEYQFNLATAYQLKGDNATAIGLYQKLAQTFPQDSRVWFNLGEAHYKLNNIPEALKNYKQAQAHNHPQPSMYLRIADCLQRVGKTQEARIVLNELANGKDIPDQIRHAAQAGLHSLA